MRTRAESQDDVSELRALSLKRSRLFRVDKVKFKHGDSDWFLKPDFDARAAS